MQRDGATHGNTVFAAELLFLEVPKGNK